MPGQPSINVIEFGPNPLVGPEHPNEVSLSLDDAMEMIYTIYGFNVQVEIVQDPNNPKAGKILLDFGEILGVVLSRKCNPPCPVSTRPEYREVIVQMIKKCF